MNQTLANVAVVLATIGTVTFLLPQIIKLIRTRDSSGVSSTWPALGLVINIGWFLYMINNQLWLAVLAPFVTFASYGVILWALGRSGRDLRNSYLRGLGWAVLLIGVTMVASWETLGVVLGLSFAVQLSPSVWSAYRTEDPSGVSPGTWWIGLAEALLWGAFGWFHGKAGIVTFSVVGAIASVLMLIRYQATRRPSDPARDYTWPLVERV